jgi:surface antigen
MSGKPTFEDLSTFVDGELGDQSRTNGIDADNDPQTAALLAEISRVDGLVRAHYGSEPDDAVPDHLVAAINSGFETRRQRTRRAVFWLPIAASLFIAAFGLGGSFYIAEQRVQKQIAAYEERWTTGQRALEAALQDALETKASGKEVSFAADQADIQGRISPTRTYRSRSGHWCREFSEVIEIDGAREFRRGLACREESGVWARLETTVSGGSAIRVIR